MQKGKMIAKRQKKVIFAKCRKASEEALEIAEKRRETKGKGEKESNAHLNAMFQGIERRDKAFVSEQSKEIEEIIEWERTLQEH